MNKMFTKAAAGIATAALLAVTAVPSAFAQTAVGIGGNGAFSDTNVDVTNACQTQVSQMNQADIENAVRNYAITGGNSASFNTGGSVTIYTGDASTATGISNAAGSNALSGVEGCSNGYTGVGVTGNGAYSDTNVDVSNWSREQWKQYNETAFLNSVYNSVSTGNNAANFNTNSDIVIVTGSADSTTVLNNQAGTNMLQ